MEHWGERCAFRPSPSARAADQSPATLGVKHASKRGTISVFELQHLIGELSRSINDREAGRDALHDLRDRLEYVDRTGDARSERVLRTRRR